MYPLAMALLFSGLCALANLAYPGPDIQNDRALSRGHELALVCQAAGDALHLRNKTGDAGTLSRDDIVRLLPKGYGPGLAKSDFKLAQSGPDVIVYFERCEGARMTCGAGKACGICRNGRLNDMVLPSGIPDGALVCVARGEE